MPIGANTAPQQPTLAVGETRVVSVSFAGKLSDSETLTGTPTVTEQTTTDLTIANKAVSTAALTIDGETVAAGEAVQFSVSGQLAATGSYTIAITCGTTSTPAQTVKGFVTFLVDTK
jgi:hypothetical protein